LSPKRRSYYEATTPPKSRFRYEATRLEHDGTNILIARFQGSVTVRIYRPVYMLVGMSSYCWRKRLIAKRGILLYKDHERKGRRKVREMQTTGIDRASNEERERIEVLVTREQKDLLEQASARRGAPLTV
jgi:hypothetical protein